MPDLTILEDNGKLTAAIPNLFSLPDDLGDMGEAPHLFYRYRAEDVAIIKREGNEIKIIKSYYSKAKIKSEDIVKFFDVLGEDTHIIDLNRNVLIYNINTRSLIDSDSGDSQFTYRIKPTTDRVLVFDNSKEIFFTVYGSGVFLELVQLNNEFARLHNFHPEESTCISKEAVYVLTGFFMHRFGLKQDISHRSIDHLIPFISSGRSSSYIRTYNPVLSEKDYEETFRVFSSEIMKDMEEFIRLEESKTITVSKDKEETQKKLPVTTPRKDEESEENLSLIPFESCTLMDIVQVGLGVDSGQESIQVDAFDSPQIENKELISGMSLVKGILFVFVKRKSKRLVESLCDLFDVDEEENLIRFYVA